jgi:hypothetical protein
MESEKYEKINFCEKCHFLPNADAWWMEIKKKSK